MPKVKILVVEDDAIEAMDIQRTLKFFGYDVPAVTSSGADALKKIDAFKPDLVLMDIVLKGEIDGIECARKIKDQFNIPVIYLTAHSEESNVQQAKLTEPYGYLLKPFDETELKTTIEVALHKHEMERKLKESEKELLLTLDATTDGIWSWNFVTDKLFFSPHYYKMLGYEVDEFPATYETIKSMIHPGDLSRVVETTDTYLKTKPDYYENEFRLKTKDGNYRWFRSTGKVVERNKDGEAIRMIGNHQDITERKQMEEQLRESEERFKRLAEAGFEGICIHDGKRILDANTTFARMGGYELSEVMGKNPLEFAAPESHETIMKNIMAGYERPYEALGLRKDGTTFPVELVGKSMAYKGGMARITAMRDITERKRAEEALHESEVKYRYLFEDCKDAIYITSREGGFIDFNQSMLDLFGYTKEEMMGLKTYKIYANPADRDKFQQHIEKKSHVKDYELKLRKKDGTEINCLLTSNVWRDHDGNILGHQGIIRDITERRKAKEALQESEKKYHRFFDEDLTGDFIATPEGKIIECNPAFTEIYGFKNRDQTFQSDISEFNPADWTDLVACLKTERKIYGHQTSHTRPDGKEIHVVANVVGILNESGKLTEVKGYIFDDTERKRMERSLRESEAYYRTIFENTGTATVLVDEDMTISQVNSEVERLTGFSKEEIEGRKKWTDFAVKEELDKLKEYAFLRKTDPEAAPSQYESKGKDKAGNVKDLLVAVSPIPGTGKQLVSLLNITELKQTERALKESEGRYRDLFENARDVIFTSDLKGKMTSINKAVVEYGFKKDEVIGKNVLKFVSKRYWPRILKDITKVARGKLAEGETEINTPKGKRIVEYKANPIREGKRVVAFQTILRDITDSKKAEYELRTSEENYRRIVETANEGICAVNADLKITFVNKKMADMLGYSPKEMMGKILSDFMFEEDLPDHEVRMKKRVRGIFEQYELRLQRRDGGEVWTAVSASALMDEKGKFAGAFAMFSDITERKKAEKALQERESFFSDTLNDMLTFVAVLEPDGEIIFVNNTPLNLIGSKLEDVRKKMFHDTYWWAYSEEARKLIKKDIELCVSGKTLIHEIQVQTLEGLIWIEFSMHPIYDEEGKVKYLVPEGRDITERKKAEEQIKASLKEKEVLVQEIHHRVKNNLQIVSSLLNLQTRYVDDQESINVLQESQGRVKSMAIVHELLYQTRSLAEIDLSRYVPSLVSYLFDSYNVDPQRIKLKMEMEDVLFNIDTAIPCGLIINELVSNSLKHAFPEGREGEITIKLHDTDGKYMLTISDNGVGFPEDIDFQKTDTLGLQLVNNLTSQIDGTIELDRSYGTEFKIIFKELEYEKRY
ncbi:MAG: PAS domain S-box protein [Euryarchaeota archaeon]|nr:PAS domain S-box protein [Euryarchaeota archaeon]